MKKLPIGIQSIEKIRTDNYVYVDKTQFALELIEGDAPHYFLSRPRRFGKSLFLSTLAAIFQGNKDLFEGCHISERNYDWQPYPVLYLNLAEVLNETTQDFKASLQRSIVKLAKAHETSIDIPSAQEGLQNLIEALSTERPVVVLIDEYDKPIIDNLHNWEVADGNRKLLQS
ncbi:MAG: AAA family ATPase, partial [Bacteroidota bacterium]